MTDVLAGYQVLEVSQFAYVPAAGAALADWGADVVKVVHPVYGDVMHTAHAAGLAPLDDGTAFMWEIANRNKRSIGIDVATPEGHEVLLDLARRADVFLTNFLPSARARLRIDVDDVRAANPDIVYARGSGQGPRGPEADDGGYDSVTYWARSGWANPLAASAGRFMYQPAPGCGDLTSGFALAAGVVGALLKRERTGVTSVVDGSLLAAGAWGMGGAVLASSLYHLDTVPIRERETPGNALTHAYRTKDDRWVMFAGIVHDAGFRDFCTRLGHAEWADDPRFATQDGRFAHHAEFLAALDEAFAQRPLAEWREVLAGMALPFGVIQNTAEVAADRQSVANGYVQDVVRPTGTPMKLTATPIQFDEMPPDLRPAPDPGQHTEEILVELGRSWEDIARLKEAGAVA